MAVYHSADEAFKSVAHLTEWLLPDTRTESLTTDAKANREQGSAGHLTLSHAASPFNLAFNTKLGFFEWLELPENHRRHERFGHSMAATCQWEAQGEILQGQLRPMGNEVRYELPCISSVPLGNAAFRRGACGRWGRNRFNFATCRPSAFPLELGGGRSTTDRSSSTLRMRSLFR